MGGGQSCLWRSTFLDHSSALLDRPAKEVLSSSVFNIFTKGILCWKVRFTKRIFVPTKEIICLANKVLPWLKKFYFS